MTADGGAAGDDDVIVVVITCVAIFVILVVTASVFAITTGADDDDNAGDDDNNSAPDKGDVTDIVLEVVLLLPPLMLPFSDIANWAVNDCIDGTITDGSFAKAGVDDNIGTVVSTIALLSTAVNKMRFAW